MKKVYLQWNLHFKNYEVSSNLRTNNVELYFLSMMLQGFQGNWINFDIIRKKNMVSIWSDDYIKQHADVSHKEKEERYAFYKRHQKYYDKRWDEMPQLTLTIQDSDALDKQWEQIKKERPQYVMFEIYGVDGEFDKVRIVGKDELSEQDREYIKTEHEKYLKYQRARDKYLENHPDYSEVWRGPQDDEYESDIMKYYEE